MDIATASTAPTEPAAVELPVAAGPTTPAAAHLPAASNNVGPTTPATGETTPASAAVAEPTPAGFAPAEAAPAKAAPAEAAPAKAAPAEAAPAEAAPAEAAPAPAAAAAEAANVGAAPAGAAPAGAAPAVAAPAVAAPAGAAPAEAASAGAIAADQAPAEEEDAPFEWKALCSEARDVLKSAHGELLQASDIMADVDFADLVDSKLACVVFGHDNTICYQSTEFEEMSGVTAKMTSDSKSFYRMARLQSPRAWLDSALNKPQNEKIKELHDDVLVNGFTKNYWTRQIITITVSCKFNDDPFWNLRHVFPIVCNGAEYVMHVSRPVPAYIPSLLWPRSRSVTELAFSKELLDTVLSDIHRIAEYWSVGEDLSVAVKKTMAACEVIEELLSDALEGEHFVPRLGGGAVARFENKVQWAQIYSECKSELRAMWAACDTQSYMTDKSGRSVVIACAIADPLSRDCPLVYVSPGFEKLTGYSNEYAQGRNCRFLQPNEKARNHAFNGHELGRMKHFCTQMSSGQIFNLLLNENKNGKPFWNLLFMKHLQLSTGQRYILGLQTNIELHKDVMDVMIKWSNDGLLLLGKLREILHQEEQQFSPSERSFVKLASQITAKWILRCGQKFHCFWTGDHFCPMVGHDAVDDFAGKWPEFAEVVLKSTLELNKIQTTMRRNKKTEVQTAASINMDDVVCAVADTRAIDCPLVYISDSFTQMTGYNIKFALGRNCRFLQPQKKELNHILNGDECGRMKAFCTDPCPVGTSILNLLLNEHREGERFWNLLYMTHVERRGHRYILAVQTQLDLPMPELLRNRNNMLEEQDIYDYAVKIGSFLHALRQLIRSTNAVAEIGKCAALVLDRILAFMKDSSDDWEGDLHVPRSGLPELAFFNSNVQWAGVCGALGAAKRVTHTPGTAFFVSDRSSAHGPVVHVSDNFEEVTGYCRQFALGRNARFLHSKSENKNDIFNRDEVLEFHEWAMPRPKQGGTSLQMVKLFLFQDKARKFFWCINVSERVVVAGRLYTVTLCSRIESQKEVPWARCLVEMLAMDEDALHELQRFRQLLASRFHSVGRLILLTLQGTTCVNQKAHSYKYLVRSCLEDWVKDFPATMDMPCTTPLTTGKPVPWVAMELNTNCDQLQGLIARAAAALDAGLRHIQFVFPSIHEDERICELERKLFAPRINYVLSALEKRHYLSIKDNVIFSVRASLHILPAASEVQQALQKWSRHGIAFWLLDASSASRDPSKAPELMSGWHSLTQLQASCGIKEIGLYGASVQLLRAIRSAPGGQWLTISAMEMYPGMRLDPVLVGTIGELCMAGVKLMAYNCFGPENMLLDELSVVEKAEALGIEPQVLILKLLQAHGWLTVAADIVEPEMLLDDDSAAEQLEPFLYDDSSALHHVAAPDINISDKDRANDGNQPGVRRLSALDARAEQRRRSKKRESTVNGDHAMQGGAPSSPGRESPRMSVRCASALGRVSLASRTSRAWVSNGNEDKRSPIPSRSVSKEIGKRSSVAPVAPKIMATEPEDETLPLEILEVTTPPSYAFPEFKRAFTRDFAVVSDDIVKELWLDLFWYDEEHANDADLLRMRQPDDSCLQAHPPLEKRVSTSGMPRRGSTRGSFANWAGDPELERRGSNSGGFRISSRDSCSSTLGELRISSRDSCSTFPGGLRISSRDSCSSAACPDVESGREYQLPCVSPVQSADATRVASKSSSMWLDDSRAPSKSTNMCPSRDEPSQVGEHDTLATRGSDRIMTAQSLPAKHHSAEHDAFATRGSSRSRTIESLMQPVKPHSAEHDTFARRGSSRTMENLTQAVKLQSVECEPSVRRCSSRNAAALSQNWELQGVECEPSVKRCSSRNAAALSQNGELQGAEREVPAKRVSSFVSAALEKLQDAEREASARLSSSGTAPSQPIKLQSVERRSKYDSNRTKIHSQLLKPQKTESPVSGRRSPSRKTESPQPPLSSRSGSGFPLTTGAWEETSAVNHAVLKQVVAKPHTPVAPVADHKPRHTAGGRRFQPAAERKLMGA